jgi:hypothetical protein
VRYRPRLDATHREVAATLRAAGYDFLSLASLGKGAPDALVHRAGMLRLLEIKSPRSIKRLKTEGQQGQDFARRWPVLIVQSGEDALRQLGAIQ